MITYPAKYTVVLKSLLDNEQSKQAIDKALSKYKLYEPKSKNEYIPRIVPTREEINNAILNRYKYREIGFETVGRFLDELEIAMNEIMPYYNQIFFTQDQDFNIIYNVDYKRTIDTDRTGKTTGSSSGTASSEMSGTSSDNGSVSGESNTEVSANDSSTANKTNNKYHKNIKSDTPQDSLSITADSIYTVKYANEVNWDNDTETGSDTTSGESSSKTDNTSSQTTSNTGSSSSQASSESQNTTNGTSEDKENIFETVKGNYGQISAQRLVLTYRESILNTIQNIVNDRRIAELFMLVY